MDINHDINYHQWEQMHKPVPQARLSQMKCEAPGCDHSSHEEAFYMHAACHMASPVQAAYFNGSMYISCATCGRFVVRFEVKWIAVPQVHWTQLSCVQIAGQNHRGRVGVQQLRLA